MLIPQPTGKDKGKDKDKDIAQDQEPITIELRAEWPPRWRFLGPSDSRAQIEVLEAPEPDVETPSHSAHEDARTAEPSAVAHSNCEANGIVFRSYHLYQR